jgi:cytochrome c-type biogenesis protein CcsB
MDDKSQGHLVANDAQPVQKRILYTLGQSSFVLKQFLESAKVKIISNPDASPMQAGQDALRFKIDVDGITKEVTLFGQVGVLAKPLRLKLNGVDIAIGYGSKILKLPFTLYLKDFQLDRYPGSMSPSSYASEVILIDKEQNINKPFRIFMNNVLAHRGYRFFQSSYDRDEKGTILSVNHDPGTLPSYIGYALLALGLFWSLFSKNNRFAALSKKAKMAAQSKAIPTMIALLFTSVFLPLHATELDPALKTILAFDKTHAAEFGKLIVQDSGGRMKPVNTIATEILAKIHRSESIDIGAYNVDANQAILGMMIRPDAYQDVKIILTHSKYINKIIGARENARYASFAQFFTDPAQMRGYKLASYVEEATRKAPKNRNKLDQAVLKIDEKVNVSYMVYSGGLIKIWPKKNDVANKWYATIDALQNFSQEESNEIRNIAIEYFTSVDASLTSGDWSKPNSALKKIAEYQKFYGAEVYPSSSRIQAEVFYNEAKIFERLFPLYMIVGFILLILSFVKILKPAFKIEKYMKVSLYLMILFFAAHTIGLANRWYISGHAPWSDGYESMIYISWSSVLAGFIFSKRSSMTMASTGILTGLILFVAHLNWMNPQVTNLVPVLNSYWLSIHVSLITASYGFIGLGALLGFVTLLLFVLKNEKNNKHITYSIKELNAINEMSLMVGLALLTIGNFLGGVWANESWGRYWGWDPKETWALVTILVYSVVVHIRFIKSLYSEFAYSVISLLSFTSVLMTYFGVNYYLAGLHSYGKGDPVPIPDFVPISYTIIFIVIFLAYRNRKLA